MLYIFVKNVGIGELSLLFKREMRILLVKPLSGVNHMLYVSSKSRVLVQCLPYHTVYLQLCFYLLIVSHGCLWYKVFCLHFNTLFGNNKSAIYSLILQVPYVNFTYQIPDILLLLLL
jgi:hypothetical protein